MSWLRGEWGTSALDVIRTQKEFFFFKLAFNESVLYSKYSAKKLHEKFQIHIRLKKDMFDRKN